MSADPTAPHIERAMVFARVVSTVLCGYCEMNVEDGGDPVPLDLPHELRAAMQLLIDVAHDTDVEAQTALAITIGTEH